MKKFLYVVGLASLLLFNYSNVNAANEAYFINKNNIEMTEKEYHNLLAIGFTKQQIDGMSYQTFTDSKDIEGAVVAESTKYIKTTTTMKNGVKSYKYYEFSSRDEIDSDIKHKNLRTYGSYYDGLSIDEYRILVTKIISLDDDQMMYKLDVDWLTMPTVRSTDIMGIGIEPSKVTIYSSIYCREDWITTNDEYGYDEVCAPKYENTGGSFLFELPTGSIRSLQSSIAFTVRKINPNTTLEVLNAVGDYAHATQTIYNNGVYNYYNVNHGSGIVIDVPYANSYESSVYSNAMFIGEW